MHKQYQFNSFFMRPNNLNDTATITIIRYSKQPIYSSRDNRHQLKSFWLHENVIDIVLVPSFILFHGRECVRDTLWVCLHHKHSMMPFSCHRLVSLFPPRVVNRRWYSKYLCSKGCESNFREANLVMLKVMHVLL